MIGAVRYDKAGVQFLDSPRRCEVALFDSILLTKLD